MLQAYRSPREEAPSKHFHIFGCNISFSMSPEIHMAGFRKYGFPYTYDIREPVSIDEVAHLIEDESFGGASVTMPHKLAVHKFCASQTEHAESIGAINTLIVRHSQSGNRYIVGDNTDWSGLHGIILSKKRRMVEAFSDWPGDRCRGCLKSCALRNVSVRREGNHYRQSNAGKR